MKKIGFVDCYLSEWHANNYVGWIEKANEALSTDYKVCYAWAEREISLKDGLTSAQWCEKYGVALCQSLKELCENSDVIVILAPSDPDRHLSYCKEVFPFGKRVYVDKTFAPDSSTAEEIFALSEQYHTPFFSTSALRFTPELDDYVGARNLILTGGGSNLPEYIIHQVENVIRLLGTGSKTVCANRQGDQWIFDVRCSSGAAATLIFASPLPFYACAQKEGESSKFIKLSSDYFSALISAILSFFETGVAPFDSKECLAVMALRDAVLKSVTEPGVIIPVQEV